MPPVFLWIARRLVIFLLGRVVKTLFKAYMPSLYKLATGVFLIFVGAVGGIIAGFLYGEFGAVVEGLTLFLGICCGVVGARDFVRVLWSQGQLIGGLLGPLLNLKPPAVSR